MNYAITLYSNDAMYNVYGDFLRMMMTWSCVMLYKAPVNDPDLIQLFSRVDRDKIKFNHPEHFESYYLPLEERLRDYLDPEGRD